MPFRVILSLFLLTPWSVAQGAAVNQPDEVAALMAKHWANVNTFRAQFRENYRGRVRRGELVFKKPALMHVRYLGSDNQTDTEIVVNKKKLFVYLRSVNVVSEQDLTAETGAGDLTSSGVLNASRLVRLYYFNFADAKAPVPVVKAEEFEKLGLADRKAFEGVAWRMALSPRDITQGLERLELWVDEDGAVRRCKARTVDERIIDLLYFDLRRNETVGDKEFEFEVPASAQVVKNALLRAEATK